LKSSEKRIFSDTLRINTGPIGRPIGHCRNGVMVKCRQTLCVSVVLLAVSTKYY